MKSSTLSRQPSTEKESTKSENLTEYLIEAIVEGQLAPGSKISEPELAKQFQVSRGPLREALMRVEGLGLIERIPHIGARVIQLSPIKLVELYAVREALEGMAARLAARNITEIELAGFKAYCRHIPLISIRSRALLTFTSRAISISTTELFKPAAISS